MIVHKLLLAGFMTAGLAAPLGGGAPGIDPAATEPAAPVVETSAFPGIDAGIDPIVTGRRISPEYVARWKANRARFEECGLCGSEQPYPGD